MQRSTVRKRLTFVIILMKQQQKTNQDIDRNVYLFVNPGSGGGIGKQIIDRKLKQEQFMVPRTQKIADRNKLIKVLVHFYSMKDSEERERGFMELKSKIQAGKPVILAICGGDGSVMWVVTQLSKHNIDHKKAPIAMIPLGTGNDFSQVLGWGKEAPSDLLDQEFFKLKKRISYWLSAQEGDMDIWMMEAEAQDYGKFEKVQDGEEKVLEGTKFSKHWVNYFSFGIDGKIGYSFDMHRTSSRIGNLAMYGVLGVVKSFTRTKTLGELTTSFRESREIRAESPPLNGPPSEKPLKIEEKEQSKMDSRQIKRGSVENHTIFERGSKQMKNIEDNQNLLALNIDSLMGGIKGVWANSKLCGEQKPQDFVPQSHSDGQLQFVSFGGAWSMGFEKTSSGNSERVCQGTGPFEVEFAAYPPEEKHRTYLQCDGEFIRFTHPRRIKIERSSLSATGQIRVLKRVPLEVQKNCCGCVKQPPTQ